MSDIETIVLDNPESIEIARLNDKFRLAGKWMVTPSVLALPDLQGLYETVRVYSDFDEDNDPYGEHDFGAFDWHGEKIFWKIDYYDQDLSDGQDPLSPDCRRVLTVYLASEH